MNKILHCLLCILLRGITAGQVIPEGKLSAYIDSISKVHDANDPESEPDLLREIEKLKMVLDSAMYSSDTSLVNGQEFAERTAGEMEQLILSTEVDTAVTNGVYASMQDILISVGEKNSVFTIENIPNFRSVSTLIIRGNAASPPLNISDIIRKLSDRDLLENLYVYNFNTAVSELPDEITTLKNLKVLGLFGNDIHNIPTKIGELENLQEIYLDANPIAELPYSLKKLTHLKILGLAKTNISAADFNRYIQMYPQVKILQK